jgi:hypothetical protein
MHLWLDFYVGRPMFGAVQLDGLQSAINELLPQWSSTLRATEGEASPRVATVDRQLRLYDAVHRVAAPKRGVGLVELAGAYEGVAFFLIHCEHALPAELNHLAIEVYEPIVEGQPTCAWAREMFEALPRRLPIRHGNVRTREEYTAKNMIDDETGVRAIGPNLADGLKGLYWLNYFGPPYVELIGRERLLSAPAYEVKQVGDGILLALDESADAWQTLAYQRCERDVIEHVGKQFFFSRWEPDRELVAPDFRSL